MARHTKKRKKGSRRKAWLTLGIFCLAAFFLGYILKVSEISIW